MYKIAIRLLHCKVLYITANYFKYPCTYYYVALILAK